MIPNIGFDLFCGAFPPIRVAWEIGRMGAPAEVSIITDTLEISQVLDLRINQWSQICQANRWQRIPIGTGRVFRLRFKGKIELFFDPGSCR